MRRKDDQPILVPLTPAEHAAVVMLASGDRSINDYVRRVMAEDAARRGVEWPIVERSTRGARIKP